MNTDLEAGPTSRHVLIRNGKFSALLSQLKERRQRRKTAFAFVFGLILNIAGSGLGLLKCEIDRKMIEVEIDSKLQKYGLLTNATLIDGESSNNFKVPSIVLVVLTTFGRIFNVIGTIKMFQAFSDFISQRRRKNLRTTTERLSNGEGESEWSEAIIECCTFCGV
uniref:Uncharacterized protein n=1 Tax=Panagrolaimus superbus TaxID=310955 RepID=A0A914Z0Z7_9BILA